MRIWKFDGALGNDRAIVSVLASHYGDGSVYRERSEGRTKECNALDQAKALGFVTDDGVLTQMGYAYWRQQTTF